MDQENKNASIENTIAGIFVAVNEFRSAMEVAALAAEKFINNNYPLLMSISKAFTDSVYAIGNASIEWSNSQKHLASEMSKQGWFPNWFTFFSVKPGDLENLDQAMISSIDECWNELTARITEFCPEREEILNTAFILHKEENYIASIPLFLSQSDGICSERFSYFFSKSQRKDKSCRNGQEEILYQVENGDIAVNFFGEILLQPLKEKLQISNGIPSKNSAAKKNGPNRHGILHGSIKTLDYGTKLNSYKAFSFLAFIVYLTKDAINET